MATNGRIKSDRAFFTLMGIAFLGIAVVGFWPTFVGPVSRGGTDFPISILFHALVMFGWLAVFIIQAQLPGAGKIHLHKRLGYASIMLFIALWISSITISLSGFSSPLPPVVRTLVNNLFFLQIVAWLLSPALFIMAIQTRKTDSASHKRYMFLLTFFLIEAAASRIKWLPGMSNDEYWVIYQYLYLDVFLLILLIYDRYSLGHLPKATKIGLGVFAVYQVIAVLVWDSEIWLRTADMLLNLLTHA